MRDRMRPPIRKRVISTIIALMSLLLFLLPGCIPYFARIIMPLETTVVDAEDGTPVEGAHVLRIVSDIHDVDYSNATIDRGKTDANGYIEMDGKRSFGFYVPAPGGWPVPNHQIAIWKPGYQAFVFSQYGDIEDMKLWTKRKDLIEAVNEVPAVRKKYTPDDNPEEMFENGKVKLHRIEK